MNRPVGSKKENREENKRTEKSKRKYDKKRSVTQGLTSVSVYWSQVPQAACLWSNSFI